MKTQEILTVEFRYMDAPQDGLDLADHRTEVVTIGIYDTLEEAIKEGNKTLGLLSKYFEVRHDDKFKKVHLFGSPKRLVTNTCYSTKGIQYFAQIKQHKFSDLVNVVGECFDSADRWIKWTKDN